MRTWTLPRASVAVALCGLACSGLFSRVSVSDDVVGRGTVTIPVPSSAVITGFTEPGHRQRVEDALCSGEIAVWGHLEQAVATSLSKGEVHADVTDHYTRLILTCPDRAYCDRARARLANSTDEVAAFYVHVLATCGDLVDRVHYRQFDAEPRAAATFYTSGTVPVHREPADDGALLLAVERLIQRGSEEPALVDGIWGLLRLQNPEAAEVLAPLVPTANLNIADELLAGLAGQAHPAAVAAVEAACTRAPDQPLCTAEPKPEPPDHDASWLATLSASVDPDRAQALLDAHPELHEAAVAHLEACGAPCGRVASLLVAPEYDAAAWLDEQGVDARPDRAGKAAFHDSVLNELEGRGRLAQFPPALSNERRLRRLARIASPQLDEVFFHDGADEEGAPLIAAEADGRRYQIPVNGDGDLGSAIELLNHVLSSRGASLRLLALADAGDAAVVVAVTPEATEALAPGSE